jgi:pSer/pThr/pTyr-binding forkhead associated (FHA) protein
VSESWVFGTDGSCDVRVSDAYASNRHCCITREDDGRVWIEDLGSTNGTWVNGVRVWDRREIRLGARIRIGRSEFPWEKA